jgi:hypothetical protein
MMDCHIALLLLLLTRAPGQPEMSNGEAEARRACLPCHSIRIVAVQRLPRATWDREISKMENWGALIRNRQLLLDWLTETFGENAPAPPPLVSRDGRRKER